MTEQIRIIRLHRSGSRVKITISILDRPLVVSEETVHRHRLIDGIVITKSQLEQLQQESQTYLCDSESARLLALREHSIGELRRKLRRREFPGDVIEETIKKYRRRGLLDDSQYAYKLSRHLLEQRPCGRSYLTAYLQKKMISRELAEKTAQMVLADSDDSERAKRALEKRWSRFEQFELEQARNKSYNYLARRGFSYDAAKKAFEQLLNEQQRDNQD
jgi:regulatory protein